MRSRFGYRTPVPMTTSSKGVTKSISFKDGVDTYTANDDLKPTQLVAANDARFVKIGKYKTRKGLDRYSIPVGEAINVQNTSVTGASTVIVSGSQAVAQKLTIATTHRLTKAEINIRTTSTSRGTILVELYTNNSGAPGTLIGRSSIRAADVGSSFAYKPVYFVATPLVTAGDIIWIVVKGQSQKVGNYEVSTTTAATTALVSTDTGFTWSATSYSANVKLSSAPDGGVKGLIRVYRPNGQKITVFAAGTSIYSVDDSTGATTVVKSGLDAAATTYRFEMVQDAVYWVNGLEKPYKWDFTTVTQITACPFIPDAIMEHKGMLFFKDTADKTKFAWTNFGLYDTFTSTDFQYAPAPKSADSLKALAKLNGIFYLYALRNKFQFMGADTATFQLDEAPSQRGTFSQESLVFDANYIYAADDEGVWMFNGSEERNLAKDFLEDYLAIPNKNTIQLDISTNRLYIFYAPAGSADNTECFVVNLLLNTFESLDKNTPIGRTYGRDTQDNLFIQASNRVAAVYYGELETNDYCNLGDQLQYELKTAATPFDDTTALKRVPKWRPAFAAVSGDYSVRAGYAKDLQTEATWTDIAVGGTGPRFNTGLLFNTGVRFGGNSLVEPKTLHIDGTFTRLQRRYQHIAAREPVEFDSETMTVQTQRLI